MSVVIEDVAPSRKFEGLIRARPCWSADEGRVTKFPNEESVAKRKSRFLLRDYRFFPGIENGHTEAREVFDVTSDNGEVVFDGGCSDQAIGRIEGRSAKLAFPS